jgi:hypothetical protein
VQLLWAEWLREELLAPVPHRHVVLTTSAHCPSGTVVLMSLFRQRLLVRLLGTHAISGFLVIPPSRQ